MLATHVNSATTDASPIGTHDPIVVLLVDDQFIIGRAIKELLRSEKDIQFHFCQNPSKAVALAEELAPTVVLLDLTMAELDGLSLLRQFQACPGTREIPIIVLSGKEEPLIKAHAFALGASDYLIKLPNRVELIARIRHHSRGYTAQLGRNEAYRKLAESERQMASEVAEAAQHVLSLLPPPMRNGPIQIDWRFIPSTQLGGDAFGYQWLDEQHLAVYLLDVSGHGVGASLLAVTVLNTLLHRTLPQTDFHDPASVMRGLNKVFNMDKHGGRFFTIWYGVFAVGERILTFSGGGHPPALLFSGPVSLNAPLQELATSGPPIGIADEMPFTNATIRIPQLGRLFLYSDGVVEIGKHGGEYLDHAAFTKFAAGISHAEDLLERALNRGRQMRSGNASVDDCSLVLIDFV